MWLTTCDSLQIINNIISRLVKVIASFFFQLRFDYETAVRFSTLSVQDYKKSLKESNILLMDMSHFQKQLYDILSHLGYILLIRALQRHSEKMSLISITVAKVPVICKTLEED